MGINDKLPGINWRVPANTTNLEFQADVVEEEILEGRRLMFAGDLSIASPGIVTATDPTSLDGTDTTEPLMVAINPENTAQVIVYPGTAVVPRSHQTMSLELPPVWV